MSGRPLGQHFLSDPNVIRKIVESADLHKDDKVLEIGPGRGAITLEMVKQAGLVKAVELDAALAQRLPKLENLQVVQGNFLELNLKELLTGEKNSELSSESASMDEGSRLYEAAKAEEQTIQKLSEHRAEAAADTSYIQKKWKVVANLPYYITTPIIEKLLLEGSPYIDTMVIMIQKEVADRIQALACRDTSAFSCFVHYYAQAKTLFKVKPGSFSPPPQVDSAVMELKLRRLPEIEAPADLIFKVTRQAFNERRKTLRKSLQSLARSMGKDAEAILTAAGVQPNQRPEELTLLQFSKIALALKQ